MSVHSFNASWCEINLARIDQNWQLALEKAPSSTKICAVLKADAYGHGIENIVPILCRRQIDYIGITSNSEARAVRDAGFDGTLIRLRSTTREEAEYALPYQIDEQVGTVANAQHLARLRQQQSKIGLHLSLNAGGMSRDGLEISSTKGQNDCSKILEIVGEQIVGICTHFPSNEPRELQESINRFHRDVSWVLENSSLRREDLMLHGGSTFTLLSGIDPNMDMMRCGAILYGIAGGEIGFAPTMALKARVTNVAMFPKGSTIGYDRAEKLHEDRLLANVSLGYANGYVRQFAGRARVLIHGMFAPVMGKISMNTIVVDVGDLPDVKVGDEVVAFGEQNNAEIDVDTIEAQSGTIMADLFTDWGHRNPRILFDPNSEL